ncbi:hypothetical protein A3K55_01300 [Candidatus Shapirobacteria bacterium RBG_13_44_7]|uniref:tRNA/rRNA methyltransferase SpoU type domain-containing protein n=1 Tax=Candidatus Shapirobacteria bacterium RBG_13_44_7 TaxID=1802149 RepID=A0A1F7SKG2_9BACT|nr:MAG: hypothetical protein A3K55_01300 [Candidatus Shapirobacteria bacterium RBG_13_44_7]
MKLNSHQLRATKASAAKKHRQTIKHHQIVLVLDNVLDTYNVGSFFRLADAIAAQKIYLCGQVVTPPNTKIHRASIGTWKFVDWEHFASTTDCLQKLKHQGYQIIACEQSPQSINYLQAKYKFPLALIVGSEVNGVGESVLKLADQIVEIPMHGINKSLNVLIATSVIAYQALAQPQP